MPTYEDELPESRAFEDRMNTKIKSLPLRMMLRIVGIVFISLIVLEISLGVFFWISDKTRKRIVLLDAVDHPYTYFAFAADRKSFINEDGLYTKAPKVKAAGKYRIILVGGSVARSNHHPYDQTISSLLERELNARLATGNIEVVNAGMSGYVAEQEFIFIQLVLQHYQPDMIIALDGYNDLFSFDINRPNDPSYAPQSYSQFKAIQQGRNERKLLYPIKVCFRNILRARYSLTASNSNQRDYAGITDEELGKAAGAYMDILRDMRDFSSSKHIAFYSFLQPVRWYAPANPSQVRLNGQPQLAKLYARYDEFFKNTTWCNSLTGVLESNLETYVDDCHVKADGNQIMAAAIAGFLEKKLVKSSSGEVTSLPY